ncbi:MAG: HlyD family type I secretion periplasmic adaptor subunit [Alphaproteobacteria bacterium]
MPNLPLRSPTGLPAPTDPASKFGAGGALALGVAVLVLFFGGLGTWAVTAELDAAVVARGELIYEGDRRDVQHLEGGVVERIFVDDGDAVVPGGLLIRLRDVGARARVSEVRTEYHGVLARAARLEAERAQAAAIRFPEPLRARAEEASVAHLLDEERKLFASRVAAFESQKGLLRARIPQYERMITGLKSQIAAAELQIETIEDETRAVATMVEKGLERRPRLQRLQRERAALEGELGELTEKVAQTRLAQQEIEERILDFERTRRAEIEEELAPLVARRGELRDKLQAAKDVRARTEIRAPIGGVVHGMQVHAEGAVIKPGEPLMSIVPDDERVVVDARVRPQDIELVSAGQSSRVVLSAYNQSDVPPIAGEVLRVSADRLQEAESGETYFLARLRLDEAALRATAVGNRLKLVPGMPAEVFINTGSRTPLDYLLEPLRDSFQRAFRET